MGTSLQGGGGGYTISYCWVCSSIGGGGGGGGGVFNPFTLRAGQIILETSILQTHFLETFEGEMLISKKNPTGLKRGEV